MLPEIGRKGGSAEPSVPNVAWNDADGEEEKHIANRNTLKAMVGRRKEGESNVSSLSIPAPRSPRLPGMLLARGGSEPRDTRPSELSRLSSQRRDTACVGYKIIEGL